MLRRGLGMASGEASRPGLLIAEDLPVNGRRFSGG